MRRCYTVALTLALAMVPTIATVARAQAAPAKDPALATTLSFLVPGAGEFYAGAPGTGAVHLVTDLAATGAVLYGISCNSKFTCNGGSCSQYACTDGTRGTQWIVGGAALVVTNTLFSMWDAHHAATNYNRVHGLTAALRDARPLVALGSHGETRIGISL